MEHTGGRRVQQNGFKICTFHQMLIRVIKSLVGEHEIGRSSRR